MVVEAVNDVTVGAQAGALYFSSAGNSGNKNDGTSGAWEGDFVDGGSVGPPFPGTVVGNLHNFGGANFNTLTSSSSCPISGGFNVCRVYLKWSDPLGASSNDYDFFLLTADGMAVLQSSTNLQTGTQDPQEFLNVSAARLVVVKKPTAQNRFLHINTNRGRLATSTSGVVFGHNAGVNTISIAASPAGPAVFPPGPVGPFPGIHSASNLVEVFSSDGPRRIFFNSNGSAITPGNFSSTGGQLLQKPDITAADGVTTTTPGFLTFFGTSAAAPHAGALAALLY